jgi:hypothetical protein
LVIAGYGLAQRRLRRMALVPHLVDVDRLQFEPRSCEHAAP